MPDTAESRLLEAAERLFADRGYSATTTRALAEAAGVNEVTLFRLFGSKIGLLVEVFRRAGVEQMRRDANTGEMPADAREALSDLANREIERSAQYGVLALRISFEARTVPELAELMGDGPAENLRTLTRMFERWQSEGQIRRDVDARLLAEAFASITSSVVMYRHVLGVNPTAELPLSEVAKQLCDVFLEGVMQR